jgi:DNA-directed RNA polymerase subunit M/transcription elongation factor TFIIS
MRSPFCNKCENMLYIKISENDSNEIEYFCRFCGNVEKPSDQNMVLTILNTATEDKEFNFNHIVNEYTKYDPTLPRINNMACPNESCPKKDHKEIIYIRYDDKNLKYLYLCTECDFVWNRS